MLKKLIIRFVLGCVFLVSAVATAIGVAVYLAFQPPAFYATQLANPPTAEEQAAAEQQWQATKLAFEHWLHGSVAAQKAPAANLPAVLLALGGAPPELHTVQFTEEQINAQLAATGGGAGDLRNPRLTIGNDRVDFACELVTNQTSCVLSTQLQPTITPDGDMRLDILAIRIGKLPLPLKLITGWLPADVNRSARDMTVQLTGPTPHVVLNLADTGERAPTVESIRCTDGQVLVEFRAPAVEPKDTEQLDPERALSRLE